MKKLSAKEYVILDLLRSSGEMYGLEMVKASNKLKRGTVYVTLDRMTDKGLVKSRQVKNPKDAGLPRRVYQIAGHGVTLLRAQDAFEAALVDTSLIGGVV